MVAPIVAGAAGRIAGQYFAKKGISALGSRMGGMAVEAGVGHMMTRKKDNSFKPGGMG